MKIKGGPIHASFRTSYFWKIVYRYLWQPNYQSDNQITNRKEKSGRELRGHDHHTAKYQSGNPCHPTHLPDLHLPLVILKRDATPFQVEIKFARFAATQRRTLFLACLMYLV